MKIITIKSNGLGRYDDVSPFILTDGKLELQVSCTNLNGEFFLVAANNLKEYKKPIKNGESIVLDGLTAGELAAEVKHYLKGVHIKTYKIEPLILRELDGRLEGTPEITALRAEMAALKEILAKVQETAVERDKAAVAWKESVDKKIFALCKFAFADYQNNVYLGGGDYAQFCKEYGFPFKEETISIGGNNND